AVLLPRQLERDEAGAGRDVEHRVERAGVRLRDEEAPPARVLPERQDRPEPVVARPERREELPRIHTLDSMALADDLDRIAGQAAGLGQVAGVLAAEPGLARRFYLGALAGDDAPRVAVLADDGRGVEKREDIRDVASIVAMCELAEELAGGGDLEQLRAQLAQVRIVEQPPGIEEAEEAALALERTIGAPPRVATPAFLDE